MSPFQLCFDVNLTLYKENTFVVCGQVRRIRRNILNNLIVIFYYCYSTAFVSNVSINLHTYILRCAVRLLLLFEGKCIIDIQPNFDSLFTVIYTQLTLWQIFCFSLLSSFCISLVAKIADILF